MAYKFRLLRKKVIAESVVLAVICGVLLAVYVFASMQEEQFAAESQILQGDLAALNLQRQNLESQLRRAKKSISIYNEVKKQLDDNQFALNRDKAQMIINQLKDKYMLSSINMKVSPVSDVATDKYKSTTIKLIQSKVTLNFSGISDEYLLSFVNDLMRKLNGYIRVTNLSLSRTGDINKESLTQISQGKLPALVTGELGFNWVGVQPIKPPEPAAAGSPAPGTPPAAGGKP